jgi:hypothetical protein
MHILYGGLRCENEYFSSKYKSSWTERFIFQSPPQSICFPLANILSTTNPLFLKPDLDHFFRIWLYKT